MTFQTSPERKEARARSIRIVLIIIKVQKEHVPETESECKTRSNFCALFSRVSRAFSCDQKCTCCLGNSRCSTAVEKSSICPRSPTRGSLLFCCDRTINFHKSGTTSDPTNFRPIALSNCDGKLFFSLLSKSFTSYMIRNEYFDKQTQKGFLPGISGSVEHACISQEALRDARRHRRSICFAWVVWECSAHACATLPA